MDGQAVLVGDFHMHTSHSRDSLMSPDRLVRQAIQEGLTCVAVTDHNTINGALAVKELSPPFTVIVGEEVKSRQGDIIGLFLEKTIPGGLDAVDTVRCIKEQGGLVCIPHPFDRFRNSVIEQEALVEVLPHVDMVEVFNSRTTLLRDSTKAGVFAKEHKKLATAGSDAHTSVELGHVRVELPEFHNSEEFLHSLHHARIAGSRTNPLIHVITAYTKVKKRFMVAGK